MREETQMELEEFLEHVNAGKPIKAASEYMLFCAETTQESMKIMTKIPREETISFPLRW